MIQVIHRALDILEHVASKKEKASSLTEIATSLNLHQATCANIIKTLVNKNYLEHLGRKKGYRLGAMAYYLTGNMAYNQNLLWVAKDVMEDLTAEANESTLLGILRNYKRFIVQLVNCDQDLQVRSKTDRNAYETATGRILIAFLSEADRNTFVQINGMPDPELWKEVQSREDLERVLAEIRKEELAVTLPNRHIVGLAEA
jgi:IclR family transcriptional regulator, KDG regulon repressor